MTATLIFLGTYVVLALGRMPGLQVDRTGAAIIGAALMVAFNVLTLEEAYQAIHLDTIVLLFGMMIVVANLRLSGFFAVVSEWTVEHAHHPITLLAAIAIVSGALSAFFVNDTVCVVMAPLVAEVLSGMPRRNPVPYLLAVAMGSNVGSAATLTGNPQNMLIGSYSGISYNAFVRALAPVAAAGIVVVIAVLAAIYRQEFRKVEEVVNVKRRAIRVNRGMLVKSLLVSISMIAFFFAGWPISKVAIVAAAVLLITRRVKPDKVYAQVDWSLLALFAGLFVVVAGFEKSSLEETLTRIAAQVHLENGAVLSALAAVLSNIVSNVPAVLIFKPFITRLADPTLGWLRLAMASTLAGNLTIVGSVANLIVVERARNLVRIGFWEYARAGLPVGFITLAIGVWALS